MTRMVPHPHDAKKEELKAATREANETLAECKRVMKEMRALQAEINSAADDRVREMVETAVAENLASLSDATSKAMEESVAKVIGEFDKLEDILLGKDRKSRRQGKKSIPELIEERAGGSGA